MAVPVEEFRAEDDTDDALQPGRIDDGDEMK
jgi:hypothetical protein